MNRSEFHQLPDARTASEAFALAGLASKGKGLVSVGSMASGQLITQPIVFVRGRHDGPVLWLNGAVHGDEINGILATMDFLATIDCEALSGTVVATPVCNPTALNARAKRVPQDEQDLDQSFPGRRGGMLSQLLAASVFEGIEEVADVVVNFHTMNPYFSSTPYAVYKLVGDGSMGEDQILKAVSNFSPFVACQMSVASGNELPGNNAGALDYQALRAGKLAFMIELGGGSRQEPEYVRAGVLGLQRLCQQLSMCKFDIENNAGMVCRVTDRTHVFSQHGGFFRQMAQAGTRLRAGSLLGHVQDYAGDVIEEIKFDKDVLVIGVRNDPVVHSGDRVGFVALEWGDYDVS